MSTAEIEGPKAGSDLTKDVSFYLTLTSALPLFSFSFFLSPIPTFVYLRTSPTFLKTFIPHPTAPGVGFVFPIFILHTIFSPLMPLSSNSCGLIYPPPRSFRFQK